MKKFVVISHTHWDREWYMPLSLFRLRLVDLIDRLLLLLEREKDYIFHLDAQTVVLEDYLEIRPEREELLKKYIAAGNLRVGPWYLQNDFYLTDGEATVRNLQRGIAIARSFGGCDMIGYAPDQFGHVSQLPRILADFGIEGYIFGRGFRKFATENGVRRELPLPAEFEWVGADGTKTLAVCLRCWYNNAQRIPEEDDLAKLLLEINEKNFEGRNISPYILLMNGVDHLEPQDDLLPILSRLRGEGIDIEQKSLVGYMQDLKEAVRGKELPSFRGALDLGEDYDILKGCWSSRIYLKRANVRAQDLLLRKLEPLYSYLEQSGLAGVYPADELTYLWKELMRNQAHDSICGCSADAVHRHMEDSYERIEEMGEELLLRGMRLAAAHAGHPLDDGKGYSVTLFNPTELTVRGVAEARLDLLLSDNVGEFALKDDTGKSVPFEIVSRERTELDVFSPLNLPGVLDVERVTVRFLAEVPPFTARTLAVVAGERGETVSPEGCGAENEYYKLFPERGRLVLLDKRTGRRFYDFLQLEDGADRGDAYVFRSASQPPLTVLPTSFGGVEGGSFRSGMTVEFSYDCPAEYDFAKDERSAETVKNEMSVRLTLDKESPVISVGYRIRNRAKDHRIRLLFKTGADGGRLLTDSPFDCAERFPLESCDKTDSDTHHASTFASLECGDSALTLFTEGQHELARTDGGLALTVLRATGRINRDAVTFRPVGGAQWNAPENECLRTVEGRVGLKLAPPVPPARLFAEGKFFRTGLLCHADCFDPKKYSGGRFAVQSAELERFYYLKDAYEGRTVRRNPLFRIEGGEVAVTCVKRALGGGVLVRFVNLGEKPLSLKIHADGAIYRTTMSEESEELLGLSLAALTVSAKEIVSLRLAGREE